LYAILDIETTGGQYNEEGITEIAIYKFDGHEIVDQFISLVNPEIPIQPFVVKLTGINNAMLRSAPKFFEVAKRIIEITDGCVLVAHNALFDYRILRTEFKRLGYDYQAHTLCTVELAQKLIPEQPSYSLGKLVRALGIPMADRHRASGDALATFKLFRLLLAKDIQKQIVSELIKTEVEKGLEPKLFEILENLPSKTGIYYVHSHDGTVIFIGRSKNIKKNVSQHFVGSARVSKKITSEVFKVTFEETGSELISILKEREEIRAVKPKYNKLPRRASFTWTMTSEKDESGYTVLKISKTGIGKQGIFVTEQESRIALARATSSFNLCRKLNGLYIGEGACDAFEAGKCDGACVAKIPADEYNQRVEQFTGKQLNKSGNMIIVDRGRNLSERSAVVIENNVFQGYTYFDLNYQINNFEILKNILISMPENRDSVSLIRSYVVKNRPIKVVTF
jgi:DNA polymerase-3 subunit epsilon